MFFLLALCFGIFSVASAVTYTVYASNNCEGALATPSGTMTNPMVFMMGQCTDITDGPSSTTRSQKFLTCDSTSATSQPYSGAGCVTAFGAIQTVLVNQCVVFSSGSMSSKVTCSSGTAITVAFFSAISIMLTMCL